MMMLHWLLPCVLLFYVISVGRGSPITSLGRKARVASTVSSLTPSFFKCFDYPLYAPASDSTVPLSSLVSRAKDRQQKGTLLLFLTHLGDLSSFELTQQLLHYQAQLNDVNVITIAPGASYKNAEKFSQLTALPLDQLHVDVTCNLYSELSFGTGFLYPQRKVLPAYVRLLPMLMGIGSPGTIQEVLRGYVGDRTAPSAWIKQHLRLVKDEKFDVLGTEYQRPFELATIRLQNMMDVLQHWNSLAPSNKNLLTQLGGAYVLGPEGDILFEHKDSGILKYIDLRRAAKQLNIDLKG